MLWHEGMWSETYAKFAQLERLGFKPSPLWSEPRDLPENAREIYRQLVVSTYAPTTTQTKTAFNS